MRRPAADIGVLFPHRHQGRHADRRQTRDPVGMSLQRTCVSGPLLQDRSSPSTRDRAPVWGCLPRCEGARLLPRPRCVRPLAQAARLSRRTGPSLQGAAVHRAPSAQRRATRMRGRRQRPCEHRPHPSPRRRHPGMSRTCASRARPFRWLPFRDDHAAARDASLSAARQQRPRPTSPARPPLQKRMAGPPDGLESRHAMRTPSLAVARRTIRKAAGSARTPVAQPAEASKAAPRKVLLSIGAASISSRPSRSQRPTWSRGIRGCLPRPTRGHCPTA
jgi:hypothetical protein